MVELEALEHLFSKEGRRKAGVRRPLCCCPLVGAARAVKRCTRPVIPCRQFILRRGPIPLSQNAKAKRCCLPPSVAASDERACSSSKQLSPSPKRIKWGSVTESFCAPKNGLN